jgi:hypothetical protein
LSGVAAGLAAIIPINHSTAMHTDETQSFSDRPVAGPAPVPAERRRLSRLRELCDEVLASYRAAADRDLIPEQDRIDARAILAGLGSSGSHIWR